MVVPARIPGCVMTTLERIMLLPLLSSISTSFVSGGAVPISTEGSMTPATMATHTGSWLRPRSVREETKVMEKAACPLSH